MANSHDTLGRIDATIHVGLSRAGIADTMAAGGVEISGYFNVQMVSDGSGEDEFIGEAPTFDCRAEDLPALEQDEIVEIDGQGRFRYLRRQSAGIGRVLVVLGSVLE